MNYHECSYPTRIWKHIQVCEHISIPVISGTFHNAIGVAKTAARVGTEKTCELLSLSVEQVEAAADWNTRRNQ